MHHIASFTGPDRLLEMKTAAILNSRQSKFPVGDDPWIQKTVEAVDYACRRGLALLTSIGMNTWELSLALAARCRMPVIIVIPDSSSDERPRPDDLIRRFHLDSSRSGFIFLKSETGRGRKAGWLTRDGMIVHRADMLIPVSIRPGGSLAGLIDYNASVIRDYAIPYEKPKRNRPQYQHHRLNPAVRDGDLLVHFTRTTGSPWPDETAFDYYIALIESGEEYCRSAAHALKHILDRGLIFGSGRHIRSGIRAVGFTHLSDDSCLNLFRYRPRLVNPYFEPYGIGIDRHVAEDIGVRPVVYGPAEVYDQLPDEDKPYYQNIGSCGRRWTSENEWRYVGDFDLRHVPDNFLHVIVPTASDAARFAKISPFAAEALFED